MSLCVCCMELLTLIFKKWIFLPEVCSIFKGLEALASTSIIYFMITSNLHTLSATNLALYETHLKLKEETLEIKEPLYEGEFYENIEQKRSLTIDYSRKTPRKVPVIWPSLFIWIMSASVSFPYFLLSDLCKLNLICVYHPTTTIMFSESFLIQLLVSSIRVFLPTLLLLVSLATVFIKFVQIKDIRFKSKEENVKANLKLAIILSTTYLLFSLQKLYVIYLREVFDPNLELFVLDENLLLISNLVYYGMSVLRPFIYVRCQANIPHKFKKHIFCKK